MFFLYILESLPTGRYYIGSAQNVVKRLAQHNAGKTRSTKYYRPWKIIYTEAFPSQREAIQRERQVKSWKNRDYIVKTLKINQAG